MTFAVRRLTASDAEAYRVLRIEGLTLSPSAFGSSLADEKHRPASDWAERLDKGFAFGLFEAGALVGVAGFYREAMRNTEHRGHLVGVYLTPRARGRGGSDHLIASVIGEARKHVLQLHLSVTAEQRSGPPALRAARLRDLRTGTARPQGRRRVLR